MSEVLFSFKANGKELQRQRKVPLPGFSILTHNDRHKWKHKYHTNREDNQKQWEGCWVYQARDLKWELWVVNVHLEKWEIWKRGNLWFCGCSVTLLQVVMGSQWQHGAICQHELNDTKAAPKEVGGRTLTCRRGQINIQIVPVLWVVKTFFFPLTVQKWFTRKSPLCKNGRLCVSTVQKMSDTYLPSFSNFLLKIFVFLLSNPCDSLPKIKVPDGECEFHKCQDDFAVWN